MNDKQLFLVLLAVTVAAVAAFLWRRFCAPHSHPKTQDLTVTDATTWQVQLNDIAVATIDERVVTEIERRVNREWWLGMRTAISEFGTFVGLASVSVAAGLAIESVLIVLAIQGDPRGAGHTLHTVLSASEAALQRGWSLFWQLGTLCAVICFVVALWAGMRQRAREYVAEAWWTHVRRAAQVAADGALSLVLTQEDLRLRRSPRQIDVCWVRPEQRTH
jgi:hypothetical protein